MKMRIQVVIESDGGNPEGVQEIAALERGALRPESLGLTLAEVKHLLQGIQQSMVTQQATHHVAEQGQCSLCVSGADARVSTSFSFARYSVW